MTTRAFEDELLKLGTEGRLALSDLVRRRTPLNSISALVHATEKRGSLAVLHDEVVPRALDVNPADVTTRLSVKTPSAILPGALGGVTSSPNPIDQERFNRAWNQPPR